MLSDKYLGHFHTLFFESEGRLFNSEEGVVDRLTSDFPSFDDSITYKGRKKVIFNKRAQLAGGMLYGKFQDTEFHPLFSDVDQLTVFADYVLPKGLRDLGILDYEGSLADKVDRGEIILANSLEELEIKASTIHACKRLVDTLNSKYGKNVNSLHIDAKLWSEARKNKETPHHLTKTIAY